MKISGIFRFLLKKRGSGSTGAVYFKSCKNCAVIRKDIAACFYKKCQQVFHCQQLLFFTFHIHNHMSFIQHNQTIAIGDGIFHVVGNHQSRQMVLRDNTLCNFQHLRCRFGVKRSRMFMVAISSVTA